MAKVHCLGLWTSRHVGTARATAALKVCRCDVAWTLPLHCCEMWLEHALTYLALFQAQRHTVPLKRICIRIDPIDHSRHWYETLTPRHGAPTVKELSTWVMPNGWRLSHTR